MFDSPGLLPLLQKGSTLDRVSLSVNALCFLKTPKEKLQKAFLNTNPQVPLETGVFTLFLP